MVDRPLQHPAERLDTGIIGTRIPVMEPGTGEGYRKCKALFFRLLRAQWVLPLEGNGGVQDAAYPVVEVLSAREPYL